MLPSDLAVEAARRKAVVARYEAAKAAKSDDATPEESEIVLEGSRPTIEIVGTQEDPMWETLLQALDLLEDLKLYLGVLAKRRPGGKLTAFMQDEMVGWCREIDKVLAESEDLFAAETEEEPT